MWGRDRKRDGKVCGSLVEGFQNVRDCQDKTSARIFKAFPDEKEIKNNNAQPSEYPCRNLIVQ